MQKGKGVQILLTPTWSGLPTLSLSFVNGRMIFVNVNPTIIYINKVLTLLLCSEWLLINLEIQGIQKETSMCLELKAPILPRGSQYIVDSIHAALFSPYRQP